MTESQKKALHIDFIACTQYREYVIYQELARIEKDPEFKSILEDLVKQELKDYNFWVKLSIKKEFQVRTIDIFVYKSMRRILGLTFTVKFLELVEEELIKRYNEIINLVDGSVQERIRETIEHEHYNEKRIVALIKEERVKFISSIILGLNDGLIELTGALVGFSFAFSKHTLVALTGIITGLAASLSMASSAYMQAQYQDRKDAKKAALYTGMAYGVVVILLVASFIFLKNIYVALILMFIIAFLIIGFVAYYTSVLFERNFRSQFAKMAFFSLGVAAITFLIGSLFRSAFGINV